MNITEIMDITHDILVNITFANVDRSYKLSSDLPLHGLLNVLNVSVLINLTLCLVLSL